MLSIHFEMDGKKVHVCYREKPTSIPFVIVRPIFTYFWRQVIRSTNTGASKLHSAGKKKDILVCGSILFLVQFLFSLVLFSLSLHYHTQKQK